MSVWDDHEISDAVVAILSELPMRSPNHHFGRPYLTAYQIAIELERRYPAAFVALGNNAGGADSGLPTSVPQRLARELSQRIKHDAGFPVEGADLSTLNISDLNFDRHNGAQLPSSRTRGEPLSMFRSRRPI